MSQMARLTKRLTLKESNPASDAGRREKEAAPLFQDESALRWEVRPHDGRRPSFDCDLTEFAVGAKAKGIAPRPRLIHELAPSIRADSVGKATGSIALMLVYVRQFWRFLDHIVARGAPDIASCNQVTNAHGQLYKTWLLQDSALSPSSAGGPLGAARHLISDARRRQKMKDWKLLWPTIEEGREILHKDVDPEILRPLYATLKAHHARMGRAIAEGSELLTRGVDPRKIGGGADFEAWSDQANVAVVAKEYLIRTLAGHHSGPSGLPMRLRLPHAYGLPAHGPSGVPPHMRTLPGTARWFVPTFEDTAASFLLVLLHLGWNPDTALNIDVSSDASWSDWRLGVQGSDQHGTVAIYGHKGKVGKEQVAFSLSKPAGHPFQVIRSMIERTNLLRSTLRCRLACLDGIKDRTVEQRREAEAIGGMILSPWLFFAGNGKGPGGRVGCVTASPALNDMMRSFCWKALKAALRMHRDDTRESRRRYVDLLSFTPGDLRDGFAAFLYDNSLYNDLLVKRALGHNSLRTTRHYLRQRRQIAQRYKEFTQFFTEIIRFRQVDPTILYLRARFGEVNDEQRERLADHRMRTRMGMGCLDPAHPPSNLAPDHRGDLCLVQRCTLCRHGVYFEDSLPHLAVRMAELQFIKSRVPADRFAGSSFQAEWVATDFVVSRLYPARSVEFIAAAEHHLSELQDGRAYLFDQSSPSLLERPE